MGDLTPRPGPALGSIPGQGALDLQRDAVPPLFLGLPLGQVPTPLV